MSDADLLLGMLFGAIGVGFFVYGRRQSVLVPFIVGIGLMAFPYFVSGALPMATVGTLLIAAGIFIRL